MKRKLNCSKFKQVEEYFENSNIHGFRYFLNKDIHVLERLWWMVSVVLSMVGCCMLIVDSYKKWDENPVIVTFSEKMTPIKTIPFPAVTICPENKSPKAIFNFTDAISRMKLDDPPNFGLSPDELSLASTHFQICDKMIAQRLSIDLNEYITNDSIYDLIKTMAPSESLLDCKFRSYGVLCEELFQDIITEDGLCFTFNSLTDEKMFNNDSRNIFITVNNVDGVTGVTGHWTLEDGYDSIADSTSDLYPFRVFMAGLNVGLSVILGVRTDDVDYICRGPVQGFKVIIHSPNELPDVKAKHFRIPVDKHVRVSIKPNVMVTSKSLQDYSPERRQCYFNSERKLRYMQTYTQQNCYLECIANFSLEICGCVRFSMPRDSNTPICGTSSVWCYIYAEREVWDAGSEDAVVTTCNCLPACTSISYDAEISQGKCEYIEYLQALNESLERYEGLQLSQLSIFFRENQFISYERSELIGMTDFVAACGGLLGLFMGISLLSIVEFVYYFSLRLLCSYRSKNSISNDNSSEAPTIFEWSN